MISACHASTCRSYISLMCSSTSFGTPVGAAGMSRSSDSCCPAFWMRRSISRTSSRYWSSRVRSVAGSFFCSDVASPRTESSRLIDCARRALRWASVLPSPNSRSNTTCGLFCIGSGDDGPCHEMVSRYEQLRPSPQLRLGSSIISSSDGSGVSCDHGARDHLVHA